MLGWRPANARADRAGRAANPNPDPNPDPGPSPTPSPTPNRVQAAQLAADGYQHGDVMVRRTHPNPGPYLPILTLTLTLTLTHEPNTTPSSNPNLTPIQS